MHVIQTASKEQGAVRFRKVGAELSSEETQVVFSGWARAPGDLPFLLKSAPEEVSLIFRETLM